MEEKFTIAQNQRLVELNANQNIILKEFNSILERDEFFKKIESELVKNSKIQLQKLLKEDHKPLVKRIEENLEAWLSEKEGFTVVKTPTIISATMLEKMTITKEHPLANQVFWLEPKRCLRPMLAPNLYEVMRNLHRITREPVRIYEAGSCFRKESQGAQHMNEFTMLNFVELDGVKEGEQMDRLKQLARDAMSAIGIEDYRLVVDQSEVYGETLDILAGEVELASGAYGPHFLDKQWGIFEPWVGIGFGIERIAMVMSNYQNIKRVGRGISYLDGIPLNL